MKLLFVLPLAFAVSCGAAENEDDMHRWAPAPQPRPTREEFFGGIAPDVPDRADRVSAGRPRGDVLKVGPCPLFRAVPNIALSQNSIRPVSPDGQPRVWAIQIAPPVVLTGAGQPQNAPAIARYFARIKWAVNNAQYQADVDADLGTTLALIATELQIQAGQRPGAPNPFTGPDGEGAGEIAQLSVGAVENPPVRSSPTFTQELSTFAGTVLTPILIPNFARSVEIYLNDSAAPGSTLGFSFLFQSQTGDVFYGSGTIPNGATMSRALPIPTGAIKIAITPNAAGGFVEGVAIFHLDLGGGPV